MMNSTPDGAITPGNAPPGKPASKWSRGLLGMGFAASVIVLLPFFYIAFLVGMGLFLLVQGDQGMEDYMLNRGPAWIAISRLVVVGLGIGWWILMFKPLMVRRPRKPESQEVKKMGQGALFELISAICRLTGATEPMEVRVDCDMTVRATLKRGLWSLLGQTTNLNIGLPLVVACTAAEFAGALANELGRYPLGLYGRLTHLVRIMNEWLSWVALRLDPWEDALAAAEDQKKTKSSKVAKLWRAFVWVSQRPIWLVMWIARLVSIGPMRRSVMNGDRCEALLVGSAAAVEALQKLPHLQSAWQHACKSVNSGVSSGRLPDNFPQTVARHAASVRATSESVKAWEVGSLFSPSTSVRGKALMKRALPRNFSTTGNGAAFFCDLTELSRQVTHGYYQVDLHLKINQFRLVSPDEAVNQKKKHECQMPVKRYFQGLLHSERALCGESGNGAAGQTSVQGLDAYRRAILDGLVWIKKRGDQMRVTLNEWQMSWQRVRDLEMAHAYALAGLPVDSHQYGVIRHEAALYREEINRQELVCECSEDPLLADEGRLESRFAAALGMLWDTPPARLPQGLVTLRESLPALAELYQILGGRLRSMRGLMTFSGAFESLGARFGSAPSDSGLVTAVRFLLPRLMHHAQQLISGLDRVPCHAAFANQELSLRHYLLGDLSAEGLALMSEDWKRREPSSIGNQDAVLASEIVPPMMDRFMEIYNQTFSALTSAAEMAEMHLIEPHSDTPAIREVSHEYRSEHPSAMMVPSMA